MTSPRDALPATIATARLTLRAPLIEDLTDLVALADNPKVTMMTAGLPIPYRQEHGRGFIERFSVKPGNRSYAMADHAGQFIGVIGLYFHDDKPTELGYWLGEPFWGQGYAPEAVAALLHAVRASGTMQQINARVLAENPASVRVLEKCGFTVVEHTQSIVERHNGKPLLIMSWSTPA